MFSQSNIGGEIEKAIPALHSRLHTPEYEKSVYKKVDLLSHYVEEHICDREVNETKRALHLVDRLYAGGDNLLKGAIENVFVFSLTRTLSRLGGDRKRLLSIIPLTLFTLYVNQVLHKGC